MTAQSAASCRPIKSPSRGGMFLGFRTVLRKELTEWVRGPEGPDHPRRLDRSGRSS